MAGPHVTDGGQRASYALHHGAVSGSRFSLDLAARLDAAQQPVVQQEPPVLGHRRLAVLLVEHRAERQLQQAGVDQSQDRVGDLRLPCRDLLPRRGALGRRSHEPLVQPFRQWCRSEGRVEEVGGELLETCRLLAQPGGLVGGGLGQPGELGVRREGALLDQRRDPRLVEDRSEQGVRLLRLRTGQRAGRGRRQAEDDGLGQVVEHLPQQLSPDLEQVVALVEDDGQRPCGLEGLDQREPVGVQPLDLILRVLGGLGLLVVPFLLEDRERLVGQRREPGAQVALGAAARPVVRVPGAHPLALDRGVRREHHGPTAEPAGDLRSDQGLAGAGRHRHPPSGRASRTCGLERVECLLLVLAERVRAHHRVVRRHRSEHARPQR